MIPFADLKTQYAELKNEIDAGIARVLDHGQFIMGPEVAELEEALSAYVGTDCVTVASGTDALLVALMALEIGPGDEVIVPAFTFAATAEVVLLAGATPVMVDIEPDSCNIDVSTLKAAISDATRAIIPVSLYGQPADMAAINAAAQARAIAVIEDAAQSFGAEYDGRRSCGLSAIGCTSFFPSKPLGCYGDGGAIFAPDPEFVRACREIRIHGQSGRYHHSRLGIAGRMDTLQCAIVLAKLARFDWEVGQRRAIGERYNRLFDEAGISRVVQRSDRTSVFAQYTVFVDDREAVHAALKEQGIPAAFHYPSPLHHQPAYRERCRHGPLPVSEDAARRVLSLPMHAYLDEATQDWIVEAVSGAVTGQ